jgi:N6-L-threonylcarbamoyladenine synthase
MLVLGIETSCDETGVALYDSAVAEPARALLSHRLHTQAAMHEAYGGVVPELASRDHIRRLLPLLEGALSDAGRTRADIDAIAVTEGPGLVGALLVGTTFAHALGFALKKPVIGIHHLEGHLLSPLMSADPPSFPFVALLVSGGHTQLMHVEGVGRYTMLGETVDDAAGEAFDKTAKLLGLPYPGGPALARMAEFGNDEAFALPRPMLHSGNLDFSFSGLKTAVATAARHAGNACDAVKADLAASFQRAAVDILVAKSMAALKAAHSKRLVVAGGVGANRLLREELGRAVSKRGARVYFPELEWCTDNGAMIALAGALRLERDGAAMADGLDFNVRPRWNLEREATSSRVTPSI